MSEFVLCVFVIQQLAKSRSCKWGYQSTSIAVDKGEQIFGKQRAEIE